MQAGQKYRARAVVGQFAIEKVGQKGTPQAVGLLEVTIGPDQGQRMRWTGFLTDAAMARTLEELRAMGWRGQRFGDWQGIGAKEVEFTCMADQNGGKTYLRAAFVQPLRTLNVKNAASADDLDYLNELYAGDLASAPDASAAAPAPGARRVPPPLPDPVPVADGEIPF